MIKKSYLKIFLLLFTAIPLFSQEEEVNSAFTGSFGSVTLNDQIYNHFSFKPEMSLGKLGLGMDLYFYFDEDGRLYSDNWNFSSSENSFRTIVDKIYYIRWGQPFDDMYFRFGALPNVTMGHGSLVKNYSNVIDYPRYRRKGIMFNYKNPNLAVQFIHSDFKEYNAPSLIAVSASLAFVDKFNLNVSIATDPNQNKGLFDSDDDGYYDEVDFDPNNSDIWSSNQQQIADILDMSSYYGQTCYDWPEFSDGANGEWNNNCDNLLEYFETQLEAFENDHNIVSNKSDVSGLSFGVSYDLTSRFTLYSEFTQLFGKSPTPTIDSDIDYKLGYGFIPFGLKADWDKVTFSIDFRKNTERFLFHYWDQNYDNARVHIKDSGLVTKEQTLYKYGEGQGVKFSLSTNIKYVGFSFSYTHMNSDIWDDSANDYRSDDNNSLYAKFDIDTSMIYKVRIAEMFYQQRNISDPFDFSPNEDTLFGYNLGIEMSDNMVLILKGRKSYECGLSGDCDPIKTTQIETQIIF